VSHTQTSTHASAHAPAHTCIRTHLARPPREFVAIILELVGKHCRALRLELLPPVDTADGRVKLIECLRRNVRLSSSRGEFESSESVKSDCVRIDLSIVRAADGMTEYLHLQDVIVYDLTCEKNL